jgi:hypothetical protein
MAERLNFPLMTAFDSNGDPISGAKLYFYQTGTSTPQDTFSDSALSTANANPVVADSAGRFGDIFLSASPAYKVVLKDASDVTIDTWDPVAPAAATAEATQNQVDTRTATTVYVSPAKIADGLGLQDLPTVGDYFNVTGTTAITSIESRTAGREITLIFAAALTLTHNSTSLILPGGANITTAAGDIARLRSEGSGNWRLVEYLQADGGATLRVKSDGATVGPSFDLTRLSASPAASDILGAVNFNGQNASATTLAYALLRGEIVDTTAGNEDGIINIHTRISGTLATRWKIGAGIYNDGVSGGDKGAGTINVSGEIYKNNTAYTNPDYVFEFEYAGKIERFAANPGASDYGGRLSLEDLEAFTREHLHLPGAHEKRGMFERADFLLEKLEEAYLHIFDLNRRLAALEAK